VRIVDERGETSEDYKRDSSRKVKMMSERARRKVRIVSETGSRKVKIMIERC
jgi:hypothetical protein